ncbi:MAG TPA: methyltransferase domain-containing protein [Gemmatimonadaceae bacterium]|nr:methyltransferase domain-containing protein [Gemmatimonadaceae bacterium]
MTDTATERVKQQWSTQAAAWYAWSDRLFADSRPIHDRMIELLAPSAGERVLEVGAGPGDTGFLAAAAGARVVSTDISPLMSDIARKRGGDRGVTNVDFELADAQAMHFADALFDGILCRWTLMLLPNPAAGVAECFRVLKPGGRLVFAVFTGPGENPWVSIPVGILVKSGHLPAPGADWRPGILALGDRAQLTELVRNAGFSAVTLGAVDMAWTFKDADDYWRFLIDVTALGELIRSLPDDARKEFRARLDAAIVPFTAARGVAIPAQCWVGRAGTP